MLEVLRKVLLGISVAFLFVVVGTVDTNEMAKVGIENTEFDPFTLFGAISVLISLCFFGAFYFAHKKERKGRERPKKRSMWAYPPEKW